MCIVDPSADRSFYVSPPSFSCALLKAIRACAKCHGLRAIFLPKVFPDQAGNGLHLHLSLRERKRGSENAFVDRARPYGISQIGESLVVRASLLYCLRLHSRFICCVPVIQSRSIHSILRFRREYWTIFQH